jgi:hypothetical protein
MFIRAFSICVPSSIVSLDAHCFSHRETLALVAFESNSQRSGIGYGAFTRISSLQSICISSGGKILMAACFVDCDSLASVTFELDSRLSNIQAVAFGIPRCRQFGFHLASNRWILRR